MQPLIHEQIPSQRLLYGWSVDCIQSHDASIFRRGFPDITIQYTYSSLPVNLENKPR